ncbi:MAG: hypothetical protein KBG28_00620 [Kofleriaceae bacterium]|jgi:hypothetical protein|nr:hypothetical protein [Kofleriaceae bacterium]MBP6838962.1 hypothetical protein [Kofleriaceae bacterium]MBP9202452.1 hypothetical protein [Kofleriaceae bacterium]
MKKLARICLSLATVVGLTGTAFAGDPAAKPAPTPAPAKDSKPAPTPAKAPMPVKPPDMVKPTPPPMPAMPTPAPEIAAAFKAGQGTWKCEGKMFTPAGEMPMKAKMSTKMDLDKWWIQGTYTETGKKKDAYKFTSYTTFDATSKKWHRVMVDNMGGYERAESTGPKDNKVQWDATGWGPMGQTKGRHYETLTTPKTMTMWGEYSMDGGKNWMKVYESNCKK